jgi:DNA-binding protein HU-beta
MHQPINVRININQTPGHGRHGWDTHRGTNQFGGTTMNKSDLVDSVASQLETSKADAGRAIEAVIASISQGLQEEQKVAISGFGTFTKKHRSARTGMNPATKQPIQIAESTTCSFKPSQQLKETLHTCGNNQS